MQLHINGKPVDVPDQLTIAGLVAHLGLKGPVAVEVNRAIVPRADHATHVLGHDDKVEIVHFVGGG